MRIIYTLDRPVPEEYWGGELGEPMALSNRWLVYPSGKQVTPIYNEEGWPKQRTIDTSFGERYKATLEDPSFHAEVLSRPTKLNTFVPPAEHLYTKLTKEKAKEVMEKLFPSS